MKIIKRLCAYFLVGVLALTLLPAKSYALEGNPRTYTVYFDANGGEGSMDPQVIPYDEETSLTTNAFTRTGYTFQGWSLTPDGESIGMAVKNLSTSPRRWVRVYAKWEPITYKVTYDGNGGYGSMDNQVITYDEAKQLSANSFEPPSGKKFAGWAYSSTEDKPKYADGHCVKNLVSLATKINLYAVWAETNYSVVHYFIEGVNDERGTITNKLDYWKPSSGDTPSGATAKANVGYIFKGWKDAEGNLINKGYQGECTVEEEKITPYQTISKDTYYTACFDPIEVQYTVKHYIEGENGEYELYGSPVQYKANTGTRVNAELINPGPEYYHDTDLPESYENGIVKGDGSLELSVYYSKKRFSVTWNNANGEEIYTEDNLPYGTKPVYSGEEPKLPGNTSATFIGWTPQVGTLTENAVYTAVYDIPPVKHIVSFDTQDGAPLQKATVNDGEKVIRPADPVLPGYTFGGWYKEAECKEAWNFASDTITKDIVLFAKWEKVNSFKVTASSDKDTYLEGESILVSATVLDGNTPVDNEVVVFSANGREYKLTTINGSCSVSIDLPAGSYIISACYEKDGDEYKDEVEVTVMEQPNESHIVKFDLNNGKTDGPAPQEIKHGEKATKPADPSDEGWIFEGWYSDAELTTEYDFSAPIMADIKLFAKWTEDKLPTPPDPEPKPVGVYYAPLVADLKANEDGVIEWKAGDSLPLEAVKLLVDKPELSLEFTFTYEGEEHTIFIPAGVFEKYYDVTIPWYGPAWLIQYFEKSEKEVIEYTIVSGDTLNALAEKYKCTVEEILVLNPYVTNRNKIYPNNKLLIPVQK